MNLNKMQEKETENKKNYLNLILDDFYICKERLKVYKDVCPTILSERYGLKVIKRVVNHGNGKI